MDDRSAFDPDRAGRAKAAGSPSEDTDMLIKPSGINPSAKKLAGRKPARKKGFGGTGKTSGASHPAAEEPAFAQPPPAERSIADLAKDWIGLWQSELAALMTDRETQENWQAMLALWSGGAGSLFRPWTSAEPDGAKRQPRPPGPKRPPPPAAAPDVRDAEIDRLSRCIAELERRLADVERRTGKHAADRRKPDRAGRQR